MTISCRLCSPAGRVLLSTRLPAHSPLHTSRRVSVRALQLEMSPLKPFAGRHAASFAQLCAVRARWSKTIPLVDVLDARGRIAARTSSGGSNWWRSATMRASTSTRAPAASPRRIADTVPYMRLLSPSGSPGRPGPYVIDTGVMGDANSASASSQNLRELTRRCQLLRPPLAGIAQRRRGRRYSRAPEPPRERVLRYSYR